MAVPMLVGQILLGRRRLLGWCGAGMALAVTSRAGLADPAAVMTAEEPHHHVIFDGIDLRIMRVMIPPGESTAWQQHSKDYVVTTLRGTKVSTQTPGQPATIGEMATDSVTFASYEDAPAVRRITNLGPGLNHQLAFELLTHKAQHYGPADRGGALGFKMVLENERLKAWRLTLDPGEITPAVVQSGPGVRVILAGERMIDTPLRGTANETDIRAGDAAFLPPDTRSITNAGEVPLDLIEFELL